MKQGFVIWIRSLVRLTYPEVMVRFRLLFTVEVVSIDFERVKERW